MPTRRGKKWLARQKREGETYHLGSFEDKNQAVEAESKFESRWPKSINQVGPHQRAQQLRLFS